ncbi:MaoC family dehydratase [Paraburkholderia sp. BCC1884]|uniref:MaoC family dehydratase n=1 Tax=Paraburkholderia sp. BCC1884 TaxID=2562668 RepID=UPI0011823FB0|nr:MaoC family dehydratase [Paraburkholderia sp. BCC1884]
MKFSDFSNNQIIEAGPYVVTETEVLEFANRYDPQWFHADSQAAKHGRWNGLIASGWHTSAIAMRLACDAFLSDTASWGSPGLDYVKWLSPVRPGDSLTLQATIIEARPSTSKSGVGIVKWRWQLFNQGKIEVFDTVVHSFFDAA